MRRSDRKIKNIGEILEIIKENKVLRLAMTDGVKPYIIPLNYGYTCIDGRLAFYFHCAKEGKKLEILAKNNNVCFEIDSRHELVSAEVDCGWSYKFASVVGEGTFSIIEDEAGKHRALCELMKHQTGCDREYNFPSMDEVLVCRLDITEFTGKANR